MFNNHPSAIKSNIFIKTFKPPKQTSRMSENQYGQGQSHASAPSKVPGKVQEQAPQGLEERLPDSVRPDNSSSSTLLTSSKVHPTGSEPGQSTNKSHAVDPDASVVPKKLQEKLPEGVERAVPNAIHNTGDTSGLHREK